MGCAHCCLVFSLLASALLVVFGTLLDGGNTTFAVLAAEGGWDAAAKAKVCYTAAGIYLVLAAISLAFVVVPRFCRAPARRHGRETTRLVGGQ